MVLFCHRTCRALRDLTSESHDSMRHSEKRDEDLVRADA